jgi:hypothetical protein
MSVIRRAALATAICLTAALPARSGAQAAQGPPASPRDTARATVGGATVIVDYGAPSKRGRVIFGGLVPWDQVWRTGANAATQLETSADLVVGGTTIPAGKYTLFTLPTPKGVSLIVNRETGQWGTDYKADRDLVRIPMRTASVASPVERLKIALEPAGKAYVMKVTWDTTEWSVPVARK